MGDREFQPRCRNSDTAGSRAWCRNARETDSSMSTDQIQPIKPQQIALVWRVFCRWRIARQRVVAYRRLLGTAATVGWPTCRRLVRRLRAQWVRRRVPASVTSRRRLVRHVLHRNQKAMSHGHEVFASSGRLPTLLPREQETEWVRDRRKVTTTTTVNLKWKLNWKLKCLVLCMPNCVSK